MANEKEKKVKEQKGQEAGSSVPADGAKKKRRTAVGNLLEGMLKKREGIEKGREKRETGVEPQNQDREIRSYTDLITVPGVDAEAVNRYLAQIARRKFRRNLTDLSERQYTSLLEDKEVFGRFLAWQQTEAAAVARKREEQERQASIGKATDTRKERARGMAAKITSELLYHGVGYLPEGKGLLRPVTYRTTKTPEEAAFAITLTEKREALEKMEAGTKTAIAQQLESQRKFYESQGYAAEKVERLLARDKANYESEAQEEIRSMQQMVDAFEQEGEARLVVLREQDKQERERIKQEVTVGVKREMVLVADRWGNVIRKISEIKPQAVKINNETGEAKIDLYWLGQEGRQIFFDHITKEVDRVVASTTEGSRSSIHKGNIEVLFQSETEVELAKAYLDSLIDRIDSTSYRSTHRAGEFKRRDAERFEVVFKYLNQKGWLDPFFKFEKITALKKHEETKGIDLSPPVQAFIDSLSKKENYPGIDLELTRMTADLTRAYRDGVLGSDWGDHESVQRLFCVFEEKMRQIGFASGDLNGALYDFQIVFREKCKEGYDREKVLAAIYRVNTVMEMMTSEVRGRFELPNTLIEDFIRFNSYPEMQKAACGQLRLQYREWVKYKGGREMVSRSINSLTERLDRMVTSRTKEAADSVGPVGYVARRKEELEAQQRWLKHCAERFEMLESLQREFS